MAEAAQPLEALVLGVLTESEMTSIEQEFSKPLVKFANDSPANSVNKAQFVELVKYLFEEAGRKAPSRADLNAAFAISDTEKKGSLGIEAFTEVYAAACKGALSGMSKPGSKVITEEPSVSKEEQIDAAATVSAPAPVTIPASSSAYGEATGPGTAAPATPALLAERSEPGIPETPRTVKISMDFAGKMGWRRGAESLTVTGLTPSGAAERCGVQVGWEIIAVDDVSVNNDETFLAATVPFKTKEGEGGSIADVTFRIPPPVSSGASATTKCDDVGRLLCRLVDLRISITKYFMSEHEHYDRRKKKMASLLKAYVESGDPQLGEKLSSILETDFVEAPRPQALLEDIEQATKLQEEIKAISEKGSDFFAQLSERDSKLLAAEQVMGLRRQIKRVELDHADLQGRADWLKR